jgi:cytochrome c oxidase subunit 2
VNKFWSILFGVIMLACFALFIISPFVGWWLPKNVAVFGGAVDGLYFLILGITGFFFVLTEALMVYFMYVYAGKPGAKEHPVGHHYAEKKVFWTSYFRYLIRPVSAVLHNQHRVEMAWTIVPAVILLYIAFAQVNTWAIIKSPRNMPEDPPLAMEVSARMFEWRVRYPAQKIEANKLAAWADQGYVDDVHVDNEIHAYPGAKVKVFLKTRDVIHSFYLPNLRLKQDALPGKTIPVWFEITKGEYNTVPVDKKNNVVEFVDKNGTPIPVEKLTSKDLQRIHHWEDSYNPETQDYGRDDDGEYLEPQQVWELACAELCGWGHFKMRGKLFVHKDERDYQMWLKKTQFEQLRSN